MFSEFLADNQAKQANKATWLSQVSKDLKGADAMPYTSWEFEAGVSAEALLFAEEVQQLDYQQILVAPENNAGEINLTGASWRNCMAIEPNQNTRQANQKALAALNEGVEELLFVLNEEQAQKPDFNNLLKDILLPYCAVSFELPSSEIGHFLALYAAYCQSQNYDLQTITGSLQTANQSIFIVSEASQNNFSTKFKTCSCKTTTKEKAATTQIADILGQINEAATLFLQANTNNKALDFFERLQVEIPIYNFYFVEIAKLRALRLLVTQLAWTFGAADFMPSKLAIYAKTTPKTQTEQEKAAENQNLLSNTTQAMAAIFGGCNSLYIVPHATEKTEFSERIARNVSNLLREESYLDKVADAGNGSYYVMHLTDKIAEKAWELFVDKK
jgi:methylmalonyl-CoA mutase